MRLLLLLLLHGFHFDLSLTDRRPSGISLLRSAWLNQLEEKEESHYYREKPRVGTKLVQCRGASTAPHKLPPPPPPPNVPLSSGIFTHRTYIFTTEQCLISYFPKLTHTKSYFPFLKKKKYKYSKQQLISLSPFTTIQ